MTATTDLCRELANHIAATRDDDIPREAVEAANKSLLDALGVILAASGTEPAVRGVAEALREAAGHPECTMLGTPLELRRAPAALIDAKFSLPFCVALAAARGRIRIGDFSAQALLAQRLETLAGASELLRAAA